MSSSTRCVIALIVSVATAFAADGCGKGSKQRKATSEYIQPPAQALGHVRSVPFWPIPAEATRISDRAWTTVVRPSSFSLKVDCCQNTVMLTSLTLYDKAGHKQWVRPAWLSYSGMRPDWKTMYSMMPVGETRRLWLDVDGSTLIYDVEVWALLKLDRSR